MDYKKPTILIIGSLPPPYIGPTIATERLIKSHELQDEFEVIFLDISDRRSKNIGKLDLFNIYYAIVHIIKFLFVIFNDKVHLVYFNLSQGIWGYLRDLGFLIPSIIFKKRVVLHLRGSEFGQFYSTMSPVLKWITKVLFNKVTLIIVLGNKLKNVFEDLVDQSRIRVVPNGIDYTQYHLNSKSQNQYCRVLYLSNLRRRKGIFEFLESMPYVLQKHPEVCFTVAGEWREDAEKLEAEKFILKNNLSKSINFIGQVSGSEKVRLYLEHDIFVFPPVQPEGMPWVLLEAMSAYLPVISADHGAISEIVEDGITGLIVEPIPDLIAGKISYLIENSEVAMKMSKNGRKRVETLFSEKQYFQCLVKTLKEAAIQVKHIVGRSDR